MSSSASQHVPVLAKAVLNWLDPQPGHTLVDGTLGGGGHTALFVERVGAQGCVIALDRDPAAIAAAKLKFASPPVYAIHANFCDLPDVLAELKIERVNGVLLDLGLSSDQLSDPKRGFSFNSEGLLDLRFDPTQGEPAWQLINRLSAERLADVIYQYGEERFSRRIARRIVEARQKRPLRSAADIAEIVRRCVPRSPRRRIDPATRTFQALRIAVNDELKSLELALQKLPECVNSQGKVAIISFHSLEDRRVKLAFRHDERWEPLTRKPISPTEEEIRSNPRSRSARLRVAQVK